MNLYVFGNGNLAFSDFLSYYVPVLNLVLEIKDHQFLVCDFRGTDTLVMEFLKSRTQNVTVFHIGERPRYLPDRYRTDVSKWRLSSSFLSDRTRDDAAIAACDHFLAFDANSTEARVSGTAQNIARCLELGRVRLAPERLSRTAV